MKELMKELKDLAYELIMIALVGLVIMLSWNVVISALFGIPTLTFWQAVCARLLVGGFRCHIPEREEFLGKVKNK